MARSFDKMPFVKMHGLGNDFVVLDLRRRPVELAPATIAAIADRHTGIGFDQLVTIEPARSDAADVFLRFFNADGGESGACGNGTRCAAALLMDETGRNSLAIQTLAGVLTAERDGGGVVAVDMGEPGLDWDAIPLARPLDTLRVPLGIDGLPDAVCASMGNPHATFLVADAEAVDLARIGPLVEHHPLFPERANVGIAQILAPDRIRLRIWERGVGITLASGSCSCAALVAAARRGLTERAADIVLERGALRITWRADGHVVMAGPTATSFTGSIGEAL